MGWGGCACVRARARALEPAWQRCFLADGAPPPPRVPRRSGLNWGNGFVTNTSIIKALDKDWFTRISDANPFFK